MEQKSEAEEDAAPVASEASPASKAAADGQSITNAHAAAFDGTVASEAQETTGKDEKNGALIEERKTTAKHEKERIREISKEKNISGKTTGQKDKRKFRRSWKKSKEQETFPVSNQRRSESLSLKSKTKRVIPSRQGRESHGVEH